MKERERILDRARARLAEWERKARDLGDGCSPQRKQELLDRLETVRIKLEKLRRTAERGFEAVRGELDYAFFALHDAWDGATTTASRKG